jgi:lipoprotein-anchoring transpeptidase ErfK/SrfK
MVDYYSVLWNAVTAPSAGDAQWRRAIYDRSRQMLSSRMRELQPPAPMAAIATEEAALEDAIDRVEADLAKARRDIGDDDNSADYPAANQAEPQPALAETSFLRGKAPLVAGAVVIAAVFAAAFALWPAAHKSSPPAKASKTASNAASNTSTTAPAPAPTRVVSAAKDGDLAPGVDGGSSNTALPYVFRRQPTFYRTLEPIGTVIVDKLQRFLYLIEPNNVAMRYGIAVGQHCADLAGLRHIASMVEWPPWQPPPEMLNRNPNTLPGGPGNPLGARLLALDDNTSRIHGTNAPNTIGNVVAFGCIRLVNDDIVDLYSRVKISTPVVVN